MAISPAYQRVKYIKVCEMIVVRNFYLRGCNPAYDLVQEPFHDSAIHKSGDSAHCFVQSRSDRHAIHDVIEGVHDESEVHWFGVRFD